jgi:hypothetical protein
MQTRKKDMPIIMDVDEIHIPDYEPICTWVEEETNIAQEVEKS